MYEDLVEHTWDLADKLLSAAGQSLHVTVLVFNRNRKILAGRSDWAGGDPKNGSRAYLIGPLKASELILADLEYEVLTTPTGGFLISAGYLGGLRLKVGRVFYVVACSGWDPEVDLMFASLLMYAMKKDVVFHHVGFGYGSLVSIKEALASDTVYYGSAFEKPADDHARFYFSVVDTNHSYGHFYREHQRGEVVKPGNIHWDVVTDDPRDLLDFIGSFVGGLDLWSYSPHSPEGVVWTTNKGVPYGIMARREWWEI